MKKRIISILLAVIMVVAMIPTIAMPAAGATSTTATTPEIDYVSSAVLDGANTNGEYDNTDCVYTSEVIQTRYGYPASTDTKYRVVYSKDVISVLIEVIDNTPLYCNKASSIGGQMWSSAEQTLLFFGIGTSFMGYAKFYRDSTSISNFESSTAALASSNTKTIDYSEDGYVIEAQFPLSSLSETDKAAFDAGTLDIRFSLLQKDRYWEAWNWNEGNCGLYADQADAKTFESEKANAISSYTKFEFEPKFKMDYVNDPFMDGVNTNGEYDNANTIAFVAGAWGGAPGGNVTARAIYSDDGIYLLVEVVDAVAHSDDFMFVNYKIGETLWGSTKINRGIGDVNQAGHNFGSIAIGTNATDRVRYFKETDTDEGWTVEARFSRSDLTDDEKTAFDNGTLEVKLSVAYLDHWGTSSAVTDSGAYGAFAASGSAKVELANTFKFSKKKTTDRYISYTSDAPVLDGKNTEDEYNNGYLLPLNFGKKKGGWDAGYVDDKAFVRLVYSDDAIYAYLESIDSTVTDVINNDRLHLGFKIGSSFVGMKEIYRGTTGGNLKNFGGSVTMGSGYSFPAKYFAWNVEDDKWAMEVKFPFDELNETDKAALESGTLEVAFAATVYDNFENMRSTLSTMPTAGYSNILNSSEVANYTPFKLGEISPHFVGASVALGTSINVNYYAHLELKDVDAKVKFTFNEKEYWATAEVTNTEDQYKFTFTGIAPQCMGDNIKAELYVDDEVVDTKDIYSVRQNAINLINDGVEDKTAQVIYDLLAYGAAAQEYANYKTDVLVNADYEELMTPYANIVNNDRQVSDPLVNGAKFTAAGVYHANTNKVYAKITLEDESILELLTVTVNGVKAKIEKYEDGSYIVFTDDVKANDYDKIFTFVLSDGTNSQTLKYSVNAYCSVKQNADNAKTAALARAMYVYGASAEAIAADSTIILTSKENFEKYQSNSVTPTGCNYALISGGDYVTKTFRGLFKIEEFGELEYKFFFSNNVDSTFSSGNVAYRNMPTEAYKIISAKVGTTSSSTRVESMNNIQTITFGGNEGRTVLGGETFWSDALTINVAEGDWLIFEWTVEYTVIAATNSERSASSLFDCTSGTPVMADAAPMPALVGADRGNSLRVGFIGDSITMGIVEGSAQNYQGWVSKVSDGLGDEVSVWNLGLGYARADDAVNSPAWLEKAKNNDVVVICFGVNDINSGIYKGTGQRTAAEIRDDIKTIAEICSSEGAEIILFSTPPYTYANDTKKAVWGELTGLIEELAGEEGYKFFDFASHLGKADDPTTPAYGGHPNAQGCTVVADAFLASGLIEIPEN